MPIAFELAALARSRGETVAVCTVRCGHVLKVLGVKRVAGRQNPGTPKYKYVVGLHTLLIH